MGHVWKRLLGMGAVLALVIVLAGCPGLFGGGPGDNAAPTAEAGENQNVNVGDTVTLDGSGSTDPDGDTLVFVWSLSTPPAGTSLTNSSITDRNASSASFVPDVAGEYEFTLTVSDGSLTAEDTVVISATYTSTQTAERLSEEGLQALQNGDFDLAYTTFSQAVNEEPTSGIAAIGYAMMNVAKITTDPGMVNLAQDRLGLVDYPSSMNELFSDAWLDEWDYEYEDSYGDVHANWYLSPRIAGEGELGNWNYDIDGDGYLDPEEKAYAFMANFVDQSPGGIGFNGAVADLADILEGRLNTALAAIDAIPTGAEITATYKLFFETESDARTAGWPETSSGDLIDFVIGKEEVMLLGVSLQIMRHHVHLAEVLDYSLPLDEYWDTFFNDYLDNESIDDSDGDGTRYPTSLFAGTFLDIADSTAAQAALDAAEADLAGAVDDFIVATNGIAGRTTADPYSLSAGSPFITWTGDDWENIKLVIQWENRIAQEIDSSLGGSGFAYFPFPHENEEFIAFVSDTLTPGNWPSSLTGEREAAAFDFGAFYSEPQFAISQIFELESGAERDGEPVFYTWNGSSFDELAAAPDTGNPPYIYLKIRDVTLGGSFDPAALPTDDDTDHYDVWLNYVDGWINDNGLWDYEDINSNGVYDDAEPYTDSNGNNRYDYAEYYEDSNGNDQYDSGEYYEDWNDNGVWDDREPFTDVNDNGEWDSHAEYISIDIDPYVNGVINIGDMSLYGGDPAAYYDLDVGDLTRADVDQFVGAGATGDDLLTYLQGYGGDVYSWTPPLFILDDTTPPSMYFIPDAGYAGDFADLVNHSFVADGTDFTNSDGEAETSSGSFWWAAFGLVE